MSLHSRLIQWLAAVSVLGLTGSTWAASTEQWKHRAVYQTMTDRFARTDGSTTSPCNTTDGLYCGGTWRGMINHLDYIQGMGFDAVMISPIIQNLEGRVTYGEAYHGYWPLDLNSLNSHFGTHQDLLDLSDALHARDMYLMVDTVVNNMAYMTNGSDPATAVDYSDLTPFNNEKYFHPYCKITDYNNYPLAQRCWTGDDIVALPDLKTEDPEVQDMLNKWIKNMMSTYKIDGLRLDAAKHVTPTFLPSFSEAANAFMTGEVYDQSVYNICNYENNYIQSVPNYPMYYSMLEAFTHGNTSALANEIELMKSNCNDVTALASFSENHDVSRFAGFTKDLALAKNVLTFTILFDGVPMIYQGQEQHYSGSQTPENREAIWLSGYNTNADLYQLTAKLNAIRKHAYNLDNGYIDFQSYPTYRGGSELAVRKGVEGRQVIMILSTQGTAQKSSYPLTLPVSYNSGVVAMDILNCVNYTVTNEGILSVDMDKGEPRVLFPANLMAGSGLCGYEYSNATYAEVKTGKKASAAHKIRVSSWGMLQSPVLFSLAITGAIAFML